MTFKKIAIFGLGLIGGSLAAAWRNQPGVDSIVGIDAPDIIETALSRGFIDIGYPPSDFAKAVEKVELIVLATPISAILQLLTSLADVVEQGVLITDVGSTKQQIITVARELLPKDVYFIGGHPMTGSEKSGIEHAHAGLFVDTSYALVQTDAVPNALVDKLTALIQATGAQTLFVPPQLHDQIVAVVSHLPRILGIALMNYATRLHQDDPRYFQLSANGFRDMTRVASSSYSIWGDICRTNRDHICATLDGIIAEIQAIKAAIADPALEDIFAQAAKGRQQLLEQKSSISEEK